MERSGLIILLICLCLALTGCRTVEYIPQETVRTDSIYISQVKWDSIYAHDSIYVREKGDTVFVDKVRYKYIERCLHDTVYREKIDSVSVPYPVEKKLTKWQSFKIKVGGWVLAVLSGLLLLAGVKIALKFL